MSGEASELLLLVEAAKQARVSVETMRFWIRTGKLASVRPGRRRMIRRDVLEAFLLRDSLAERKEARIVL
ncbi:MAG: helix-turn-helix domain-containing protein [Polyangiaceae bacterium]